MKLYQTASGVYVGTQAEAKSEGNDWETVEIPNSKPDLIEWLNANARKPLPAGNDQPGEVLQSDNDIQEMPKVIETKAVTAPAERAAPRINSGVISDYITDINGVEFGVILSAVLSRLAELRNEGWNGLRDALKMHRARGSVERGIGILLLDGSED